jgi:hypothetical protein
MRYSLLALAISALLLTGCATAAQRQYQTITAGNRAIVTEAKLCVEAIYNAPEAAPLRPHMPLNPNDATLTQLSDQSLATKADTDAILLLHPRLKACQKTILDGLLNTTPSVIPILTREYAAADDDTILLIQRKMSWGDRVRRARDRVTATQAAIQSEARSVTAGLERQHESELARRQAALDAMARWAQTPASDQCNEPAGHHQLHPPRQLHQLHEPITQLTPLPRA